jgi:hypothetical protein
LLSWQPFWHSIVPACDVRCAPLTSFRQALFSCYIYSCRLLCYMFCALVLLSFICFPHHTTPARKHRVLLGQIMFVAIAIGIFYYILERGLVLCGHAFSFKYSGNYQCF